MTVFLDSDVMIDVLRGRDGTFLERWDELADADAALLYSPVSAAEIWSAAQSDEHLQILEFFQSLLCVSIDQETGKQAGEYLHKYGRSHNLKIADALIAAAAIRHHAALWTRDRTRYPMHELSFYV